MRALQCAGNLNPAEIAACRMLANHIEKLLNDAGLSLEADSIAYRGTITSDKEVGDFEKECIRATVNSGNYDFLITQDLAFKVDILTPDVALLGYLSLPLEANASLRVEGAAGRPKPVLPDEDGCHYPARNDADFEVEATVGFTSQHAVSLKLNPTFSLSSDRRTIHVGIEPHFHSEGEVGDLFYFDYEVERIYDDGENGAC